MKDKLGNKIHKHCEINHKCLLNKFITCVEKILIKHSQKINFNCTIKCSFKFYDRYFPNHCRYFKVNKTTYFSMISNLFSSTYTQ